MVAACRAMEADDPDGFVHDPFAARLAGDRGRAILEALPRFQTMRFGVAVRSRFLDELLLAAVSAYPIATVVSLGCGLDTRPWRLALPPDLRWLEVDFPDMLDYKESVLAGETPRCRRERMCADLTDAAQRHAVYAAAGAAPALMITEGLLMYLPAATVEAIAAEPPQHSGIAHWIADISTTTFSSAIGMGDYQSIRSVQAADFLHGEQILEVAQRHGWNTAAHRSYLRDVAFAMPRIQKMFGDRPRPEGPPPVPPDDPTGVHHMTQ
jgi:methyltransferase (TIGR00027 family)